MTIKAKSFLPIISFLLFVAAMSACSNRTSYAELLTREDHATNNFLADHVVIGNVPEDTVFVTVAEVGEENAPYYRLDEDGMLYMQVIDAGTPGNKVKDDELIYFRYSRYDLEFYKDGDLSAAYAGGNEDDMTSVNAFFRFGNYSLQSSTQWGSGIQQPLVYLPVDCRVNLIVKSQLGFTSEISAVVPYLYNLRYFRPKI